MIRMKRYEYMYVHIWVFVKKINERLNEYGEDGWELVAVYWTWYYFKREITR